MSLITVFFFRIILFCCRFASLTGHVERVQLTAPINYVRTTEQFADMLTSKAFTNIQCSL